MPTYEYECTSCGQHIEVFQRITEDPLTTCGACGGPLRKVFHPAGIVFKGSGFYATDSRSGSKPAAKEKKDDAGSSTTSTATSSSETSSGTDAGSSGSKEKSSKGSGSKGSKGSTES
ncbi:MAG TPA: FmdB family zinc ribbon protein [Actinomycetota bacterium]|jgi:putative FmdB family regulatory protein